MASSVPAFDNAAAALTARGQSIIVGIVPVSAATGDEGVPKKDGDLVEALAADWVPRFAQQSCECIDAQASPLTTIVGELAGEATALEAAPATMFSQPSMQPAPAIHKATTRANITRTIFIEERNLIVLFSLDLVHLDVELASKVRQ